MSLATGTHLGPYEILAPIGAGGMGEVYRARDTKLDRDVAIKILPEAWADDPERLARFEREAKVLASLNHPNIAQIYGVEDRALVMEMVPGETLTGPLPLAAALNYARQIAEALEAAHDKGIIHRDLKPANIMLTPAGVVKVLDFGLAKATEEPSSDPRNSPTLTISATGTGMILGTAAYMAPEQARGKSVDKRADIWAYGCVLYELLTGKRAFKGETTSDILASVLKEEPLLDELPARARPLIEGCLQKDPRKRWRDIGDVRLLLDYNPPQTGGARPNRWPWIVAAVFAVGLAITGWGWWSGRTQPTARPFMRLDVDLGSEVSLGSGEGPSLAISPDGARLAFLTHGSDNKDHLALRLLDSSNTTVLAGTEGAANPFFSPDSRWIAFFAEHKLKKISVEGGAPVTLCEARNPRGGTWGADGTILFAPEPRVALARVNSAGGNPQPATQLESSQAEITHRLPQFFPNGDSFLFVTRKISDGYDDATIVGQSLKAGKRATLLKGGYAGHYLPTAANSGHLVYMHEGTLFAAPMDSGRIQVTGPAYPVIEDVAGWQNNGNGIAQFDISPAGTLVYIPEVTKRSVAIVDAVGTREDLRVPADRYVWLKVSPDSKYLALVASPDGTSATISVYEFASKRVLRLTSIQGTADFLTWAPDGEHVAFTSSAGPSGPGIYWMGVQAARDPVRLLEGAGWMSGGFSPDGKKLAIWRGSPPYGIWILPLDLSDPEHPRAGKRETFLQDARDLRYPNFSPDGQWIAYYGRDADNRGIPYVLPFPGPGERVQITTSGNASPRGWGSGQRLFVGSTDGRLLVADYTVSGGSFRASEPKLWSSGLSAVGSTIMPDGMHVVVATATDQRPSTHVVFLLNFFDELRRREPIGK